MKVIIHTDGGSRGNPGPAAAGFLIADTQGRTLVARGLHLGRATNNVAEYSAVVHALEAAHDLGATEIDLAADSELLVKQLHGEYRVRSDALRPLHARARTLLGALTGWRVRHVRRDQNRDADRLVNEALDRGADVDASPACPPRTASLRVGALISGGGRTLLNLLAANARGEVNIEVPLVISSRAQVAGVGRAREAGLPVEIVRRRDFPDLARFSERLASLLSEARVDLVIQAGWLCLWRIPPVLASRVMNIHPALLPAFGGQGMWGHHVHEAVLAAGCKVSGCTVHFCTDEYDTGPIIVQRTCAVHEDDTPDSLAARVFEQECLAYPEAIRLFAADRLIVRSGRVRVAPA